MNRLGPQLIAVACETFEINHSAAFDGPETAIARGWPFFASPPAAREYCRGQLREAASLIDTFTGGVVEHGAEACLSQFGFVYSRADRDAFAELTSSFRQQMRERILGARVQPIDGPTLRVVNAQ